MDSSQIEEYSLYRSVMIYFAHSGNHPDGSDWQALPSHLQSVGDLAEAFGAAFGLGAAAKLAGVLHDVGKYTATFQRRLHNENIRVDHATPGAMLVSELARGVDRGMAELIAYAIAGHHTGLPDKLGEASLTSRIENLEQTIDPIWKDEIKPQATGLSRTLRWSGPFRPFQAAFMGRMIFSCLVDADFRDTEAFYTRLEKHFVDREWAPLQTLLPAFEEALARHFAQMPEADRAINKLRRDILVHVRAKAALAPGLFTLTVPTGGGKTLASLAFALDHARQHGHTRIIYAIPFTSIIDQTAAIFRSILGDAHVLEHHSAIEEERFKPEEGRDKTRLAMEDWAAPVVVTTNVQLFESLFAARPGRARKLHNIANSVIILDEAQTIPRSLLLPCVRAIDELARNYGCSIVLCTATQPALDARNFVPNHPASLELEGRELAPDPAQLAEALRRVRLHHAGEMDNETLVAALGEVSQGLIIVNSRKHALALYRAAQAAGLTGLIHLSTRQYAAQRRRIIASIKADLKAGAPCRVISTSLVECGVDFSFPKVWRAEAGLDQIAQAAGRCNREGLRPVAESVVTVFAPSTDYPPPPEIKGLIGDRQRMQAKHDDLLSPAAIEDYFGEVYWREGPKGLDAKNILEQFNMDGTGTNFAYRKVAADFRMIESGMVPVIVAIEEEAKAAVKKLSVAQLSSGSIARDLQNFIVQVPPAARQRLIACGRAAFAHPDLRADQFCVLTDASLYREDVGLLWEDSDFLSQEQLLVA